MDLHSTGSTDSTVEPAAVAVRPDPWCGVWRGTAELRRPDGSALDFDMEIRIPRLRANRAEPARSDLVYRRWGTESIRSIRWEETPFPDVRWSEVEVNGCRQTTVSTRRDDRLRVVIVARRPVGNGSWLVVQQGDLRRIDPDRV